jgi:hypothetical protein
MVLRWRRLRRSADHGDRGIDLGFEPFAEADLARRDVVDFVIASTLARNDPGLLARNDPLT